MLGLNTYPIMSVGSTLNGAPLSTEGFIHWSYKHSGRDEVLSLNVETEIITCSHVPLPQSYNAKRYLSTGKNLSLLVAHGNSLWDVWEMEPGTGEWREVRHDIKFESETENEVLLPLGWVKYPEVLAMHSMEKVYTCFCYNLDTHGTFAIILIHTASTPSTCLFLFEITKLLCIGTASYGYRLVLLAIKLTVLICWDTFRVPAIFMAPAVPF